LVFKRKSTRGDEGREKRGKDTYTLKKKQPDQLKGGKKNLRKKGLCARGILRLKKDGAAPHETQPTRKRKGEGPDMR